jgi:hypothetical protein
MVEMVAEMAYRRGCWFINSVSEVRIMWNITMGSPQKSFTA